MNENREQKLMSRLQLKGKMELAEVVEFLGISESTARRLFSRLEAAGKVIRIHGGIQLPGNSGLEYSFERVIQTNIEEKHAIAAAACQLLREREVLFCDAGTTVLCFCMELARRFSQNPMELRVYTNSLANFEVLSSYVPITLIGGEYRAYRKDFSGYLAEQAISRVHFTKCFLGTDGCDMRQYFTTTDFDTARMDEMAMRNSDETTILCASDKFTTCAQVGYASFEDVDRVVTDEKLDPLVCARLRNFGMEVITADKE